MVSARDDVTTTWNVCAAFTDAAEVVMCTAGESTIPRFLVEGTDAEIRDPAAASAVAVEVAEVGAWATMTGAKALIHASA